MKGFLLLLLLTMTTWHAQAQGTSALDSIATLSFDFDSSPSYLLAKHVFLPLFGFYLLCSFVLTAIRLILNYLLKKQIVASAVSDNVVERLLPGPQDEQNKVVKWIALLLSSGAGLTLCSLFLPLGLHSVIILLFSTALGFLVYYLFLRRQAK
ncbi:hypothetical protein H8B15_11115 [Hymenobacter sp. BT507]|uniref:Uncharacterized protein n=2 Tax=Hymenobacter citatus TaxID=2763506 RepID=A0ABR7MKL0_9BACT|nr:hypothetical protein [Hymenobacter citatus]